MLHDRVPADPEVAGLLALMLLTEARRPARTSADDALVPLATQDRSRWDRSLIGEGLQLLNATLAVGRIGEYQLLASIAALHDEAASHDSTRWTEIVKAYAKLESLTGNPMVRLNRAVAVAMVQGPAAGLALLEGLDVHDSHRLHAVRAHLHEESGDSAAAAACSAAAAARTANARARLPRRAGGACLGAGTPVAAYAGQSGGVAGCDTSRSSKHTRAPGQVRLLTGGDSPRPDRSRRPVDPVQFRDRR